MTLAAAVGPITILYLRRSIAEGWLSGWVTVAGAVTADAVYASLAAFGLSAFSDFLISIEAPVRLFGGLLLLIIGFRTLRARPPAEGARVGGAGLPGNYFSTFVLTIANPMTILLFTGLFVSSGMVRAGDGHCAPFLVLGVTSGSMSMATVLVTAGALLKSRVTPRMLLWLNRIAGLLICLYALDTLRHLFVA